MLLLKNQNKLFLYFVLTFSFFAFISPLSKMIFIILSAMLIFSPLLFDNNHLLCFWFFSACFMNCFRYNNHNTIFLAMLDIAMLIFVVKTLIQKPLNKRNLKFVGLLFAFFLISFVYSCIVSGNAYKISQSLGIILTIITLFLIKGVSVKDVTICLCLGLIISSTLSVISYLGGLIPLKTLGGSTGSYFRFGGYFCNVNASAMYCSLGQACLLGLLLSGKLDVKKWIWVLFVITLIGLSSFSKTFILITLLTYVVAILIGFITSKNKKVYIKYGCVLLVVALILSPFLHKYFNIIIDRFNFNSSSTEIVNAVTTGRLKIWKSYINKWASSPLYILFGCGITAPNIGVRTTHNFLISLLYKFGIVGIAVLLISLIYIFKQSQLSKKACCYIPLVAIILNCLSEDLACSLYTCLPLLIAFAFILNKRDTVN